MKKAHPGLDNIRSAQGTIMFWSMFRVATLMPFLICSCVHAHRPIFTSEKGIDPDTAVRIDEPEVSQVIYRSISDETPQLWLAVNAEKDFELFVQIGVPVIDRLKEFRPSFVVLGPDLPKISVPFSIPEGIGGKTFSTAEVKDPRFFHEHFTDTDSWILRGETVVFPASGTCYVVAYSPSNQAGKLWISVGTKEKFGPLDLLKFGGWKKRIQEFHEVGAEKQMSRTSEDSSDSNSGSLSDTEGITLIDFLPDETKNWSSINDTVMGGVSSSAVEQATESTALFKGIVSLENNGGFASIRCRPQPIDLGDYQGIRIRVKGDGKRYQFRIRTDNRFDGPNYQTTFETTPGEWMIHQLPFTDFIATYRGSRLDDHPPIDPAKIQSFGFMIADKQDGPFALKVDWIGAY